MTPAACFAMIDAQNPEVWRLFEQFAFERMRRGFSHYSADAILHRVRWETAAPLDDQSGLKINNNWSAFYARKFAKHHPKHAAFFRLRSSRADSGN